MIPYYFTFLLSILFCFLGENNLRRNFQKGYETGEQQEENNKKLRVSQGKLLLFIKLRRNNGFHLQKYHIFFSLAVIMITTLAWLRDYSVGTDILSYGNDLFQYSLQFDSLLSFVQKFTNIEPLYLILTYISSFIGKTPHILYLLTGIIIYSFMLAGFVKFRAYISITLSWLCFLFLLYGDTYNAMRQSLAVAVGTWAFHFAIENKPLKFMIGLICAFLFHNTAIFFVGIYGIYWVLQKNNKIYTKIALLITAIGVIVFYNQILNFIIGIGLLNTKMERYYISSSTEFSIPAILIRIPFLVLILIQRKQFWQGRNSMTKISALKNEAEGDFYTLMLFCEMFTVELSAFLPSLYRIALYFVPFRCIAYARICALQKKENRIILIVILVVYLLIVFVYQNQIKGNNDIYPYTFYFIN